MNRDRRAAVVPPQAVGAGDEELTRYQLQYFTGRGRERRIALSESPVVRRHLQQLLRVVEPRQGAPVLELGCGIGRFSRLLAAAGLRVTATDISASLIARAREESAEGCDGFLDFRCCAAEELDRKVDGSFAAVVGFFFLHHLTCFETVFSQARSLLEPGGSIAFCEPNAFNPLYYLQVTLTPGMSWRGEPGIPLMRSSRVFPALRDAGFTACEEKCYGAFPPRLANTRWGRRAEALFERIAPRSIGTAYRVFSARAAR